MCEAGFGQCPWLQVVCSPDLVAISLWPCVAKCPKVGGHGFQQLLEHLRCSSLTLQLVVGYRGSCFFIGSILPSSVLLSCTSAEHCCLLRSKLDPQTGGGGQMARRLRRACTVDGCCLRGKYILEIHPGCQGCSVLKEIIHPWSSCLLQKSYEPRLVTFIRRVAVFLKTPAEYPYT